MRVDALRADEELSPAECFRLLASESLGRVALTSGALPVVMPVQYGVFGSCIVIPTAPGTTLALATRDAVISLETDAVEGDEIWSVLVTSLARELTDPELLLEVRETSLVRWAPVGSDRYVTLSTALISGRRVRRW